MKDGRTLLISGSIDGGIKAWDLRKLFFRKKPHPILTIDPPNRNRRVGITCMSLDTSNTRLLVNYHKNCIRLIDLLAPNKKSKLFAGHRNDSFYVKSVFSPDERFIKRIL